MTTEWYTGTGRIIYDPDRGKMKRRTEWWCVLHTYGEVHKYYRWFLDKHWWEIESGGYKRSYNEPAWGAHISVVRGETPPNQEFWSKYNGEKIDFEYSPIIKSTKEYGYRDSFYILDVRCPRLNEIRKELGLRYIRDNGEEFIYHLTIARTYDE